MPAAWAEGCGSSGNNISLGFVNQYYLPDDEPWLDIFCLESVNSFDPNDKNGFPRGYNPERLINANMDIEYLIRFQNTGTAEAINIEIRDTIPVDLLDPATVRPGASSHPYTFEMSGAGMLSFTFNNIALPDSNVNEAASHGFVQFNIALRPDVPLGTVLENRAGIYFDFNAVVLTNTVWHTVDTGFLELHVSTQGPESAVPGIKVYPNPATETVWLELPGTPAAKGLVRLFDPMGKVMLEKTVNGPVVEIRRGLLPAGVYFVEWRNGGAYVKGKILFR